MATKQACDKNKGNQTLTVQEAAFKRWVWIVFKVAVLFFLCILAMKHSLCCSSARETQSMEKQNENVLPKDCIFGRNLTWFSELRPLKPQFYFGLTLKCAFYFIKSWLRGGGALEEITLWPEWTGGIFHWTITLFKQCGNNNMLLYYTLRHFRALNTPLFKRPNPPAALRGSSEANNYHIIWSGSSYPSFRGEIHKVLQK